MIQRQAQAEQEAYHDGLYVSVLEKKERNKNHDDEEHNVAYVCSFFFASIHKLFLLDFTKNLLKMASHADL